jgi:hypothetical protein
MSVNVCTHSYTCPNTNCKDFNNSHKYSECVYNKKQDVLYLEGVVGSAVIQIMTKTCNHQCQAFNLTKYFPPLSSLKRKSFIKPADSIVGVEQCHHTLLLLHSKTIVVCQVWNEVTVYQYSFVYCGYLQRCDKKIYIMVSDRWHMYTILSLEQTFLPNML